MSGIWSVPRELRMRMRILIGLKGPKILVLGIYFRNFGSFPNDRAYVFFCCRPFHRHDRHGFGRCGNACCRLSPVDWERSWTSPCLLTYVLCYVSPFGCLYVLEMPVGVHSNTRPCGIFSCGHCCQLWRSSPFCGSLAPFSWATMYITGLFLFLVRSSHL